MGIWRGGREEGRNSRRNNDAERGSRYGRGNKRGERGRCIRPPPMEPGLRRFQAAIKLPAEGLSLSDGWPGEDELRWIIKDIFPSPPPAVQRQSLVHSVCVQPMKKWVFPLRDCWCCLSLYLCSYDSIKRF